MPERDPIYQNMANALGAVAAGVQSLHAQINFVSSADGEDGDGSAGVREPRRPLTPAPTDSIALALV